MKKGVSLFLIFFPLYLIAQESDTNIKSNIVQQTWQDPGYQLTIEGAVGLGIGDPRTNFGKVTIINSIRLTHKFALGIGTGIRFKQSKAFTEAISADKNILLQVYTDFRTNFTLPKVESCYYAIGIGTSFFPKRKAVENSIYGGKYTHLMGMGGYINPSAGMCFRISKKIGFHAGIGGEIQIGRFKEDRYGTYGYSIIDKLAYCISVTSGLTF